MRYKCIICTEKIEERIGKLKGTIVRVIENKQNKFIPVCSNCQKKDNWIEKAKIRGV